MLLLSAAESGHQPGNPLVFAPVELLILAAASLLLVLVVLGALGWFLLARTRHVSAAPGFQAPGSRSPTTEGS